MTVHIALLRGVNAAGNRLVTADELTALLTELGHANARTGPKAGDLVFASGEQTGAELQTQIETALMDRFALRTDVYVRTADAWRALVAANPFPEFAAQDPGWLMTLFLKDTPDKKAIGALRAAIRGREQVRAESRQLYAIYPDGIGGSKLTNSLVEKTLGARITGRSWTAVLALAEMLGEG
ncbi:DUF1697 domain-containing protein [Caulobacter sp. BE254]|uniref:DUF1697 domain-containing protein n=1 Tax=Caulobacter sp. BE254 TaxID=2817720 RepID=UPI00286424A8|nr:DUF1697 domain-containing protein [Caulobacter sp. BE254]MDR7114570.1 uncharacterized protein (DUF1697 family) [Caulobacter sp. BE254]